MRIGIPAELYPGETRVAATPETIKKLAAGGRHAITVQSGAGQGAFVSDADYQAAGAAIVSSAAELYGNADIVLKVRRPEPQELSLLRRGTLLVGLLSPHESLESLAQTGVSAFALELLPRITRAQTMDVLSSQASYSTWRDFGAAVGPLTAPWLFLHIPQTPLYGALALALAVSAWLCLVQRQESSPGLAGTARGVQ